VITIYKLKSPSNYFENDLLEVVAKNRNADLHKIKNPSKDDVIHYSKLLRIDKVVNAVRVFSKRESSKVGVVVDSDTD